MTKERADYLRELYKNDEDIDYSDIPEITDEMAATAQWLPAGTYIPQVNE